MKRFVVAALVMITALAVTAAADPVGLGVCGGALLPAAQEDQSTGWLFGIKVRARLSGLLAVEPNIHFGSFGDVEIPGVGARVGSSLKHYGVDLTWGAAIAAAGIKPYALLGGGVYNTKRDGDVTTNKSGWSFGGGLAVGIRPDLDIDFRGRYNIVSSEGSASKKSVGLTVGITYYTGR